MNSRNLQAALLLLTLLTAAAPGLLLVRLDQGLLGLGGWLQTCWITFWGGESALGLVLLAGLLPALWVVGRSLWSAWIQARTTSRILAQLPLAAPPPEINLLAQGLGLARLSYANTPEVFAFTHFAGVVVSRGLVELLSPDELQAVLLHERCHLWRRSALWGWLLGALSRATAFLPISPLLYHRWLLEEELHADRAAATLGQETVASALLRLARHVHPSLSPGITGGALELRLGVLLGQTQPLTDFPRWRRALHVSLLLLGLLAFLPNGLHQAPLEWHLAVAPTHSPGQSC